MEHKAISIRPFIGAKNFEVSRNFYRDLGFEESILFTNMSYFKTEGLGFYLQDAYVQDWIDNSMIFLEVEDVERYWDDLLALDLPTKYKQVKLTPIREYEWGRECYLHDPSGILWHFGQFSKLTQ
jgi:catechol 2,3-dioxygenase-like lactoylglutathione lyase family enzyme